MLTEKSAVSSIEVTAINAINVRVSNFILKDGVVVSEQYHRHVLVPGDDVTAEDPKVKAIAAAIWTPAVIADYKKLIAEPIIK